jgi:methyl-accepting chemotaxis protein
MHCNVSMIRRSLRRSAQTLISMAVCLGLAGCGNAPRAREQGGSFAVDGQIALHSFMALGDGHLQTLADLLQLLATRDDIQSGEWDRIRGPLSEVDPMAVPAVLWFAEPGGTYWTVPQVHAAGNLSDRPYFPRVLRGETVIGALVVSRSTSRNTAVVAVPVRRDQRVIGVLGASVHLDSLGTILRKEMGGLGPDLRFFAIDSTPVGAIHSDSSLIFTDPLRIGDEGMRRAFTEMLQRNEGEVSYDFHGRRRTMLYRRSPVTGWWYAFGVIRR